MEPRPFLDIENLSVEDLTRMARHGIDAEFLSKMSARGRI